MNGHTPGPWTFEAPPPDAYTDPDIQLDEDVAFWIAESRIAGEVLGHVTRTARGEQAANARLIAGAPELLEVAKMVVAMRDHAADTWQDAVTLLVDGDIMRAVLAAIAKAE
jgi:hypothetical protein